MGVALYLLGLAIRNARGRGVLRERRELEDLARAGYWGDLDLAAAHVRSAVPLAVFSLCFGAAMLGLCLLGPAFNSQHWKVWSIAIAVVLCWWLLEREFAFPGLLRPPALRGVRGMFAARLDSRRKRGAERNDNPPS